MSLGGGRRRGTVAEWNDRRGFGFIAPAGGGARVFVHVSAAPSSRRPEVGDEVSYALQDERGRVRAVSLRFVVSASSSGRTTSASPAVGAGTVAVVTAFALVLVALVASRGIGLWALPSYGLASVVAFGLYARDKAAARDGRWRTSEKTLHVAALVGGWPGALVARRVLHHKTTKQPFVTVLWSTVVLNCLALAAWTLVGPTALVDALLGP